MSKPFSETYLGRLREKIGSAPVLSPAIRIVLLDPKGRVLLQKRRDFGKWGLPGGHPEEGESIAGCIRREVKEETGLTLGAFECFGYSSDPKLEFTTYPNGHQVHSFALLACSSDWKGTPLQSNDETLELRFFETGKLPDMLANERYSVERFDEYKKSGRFQLS